MFSHPQLHSAMSSRVPTTQVWVVSLLKFLRDTTYVEELCAWDNPNTFDRDRNMANRELRGEFMQFLIDVYKPKPNDAIDDFIDRLSPPPDQRATPEYSIGRMVEIYREFCEHERNFAESVYNFTSIY